MKKLILGIDDAGRGPLIGPMILAGCLMSRELEKEFKELGVKDSKMLTAKRREHLASVIREKAMSFHVTATFPSEIDEKILSGTNLNKIEAIEASEIINKLVKDYKNVEIVIDCPSPNTEAWKQDVLENVKHKKVSISCEHKADQNHPSVSAASILAKSAREQEIAKMRKELGKDFGSGYPNDPKTKEFLEKYRKDYKDKGIFRQTWATFKRQKARKEQKRLGEF